jgi:hypothetical protein
MNEDTRTAPRPAKPYQPPKVVDYGSTSKLSATKPGDQTDATNSSNKVCL